jgi:hypothetical protein
MILVSFIEWRVARETVEPATFNTINTRIFLFYP